MGISAIGMTPDVIKRPIDDTLTSNVSQEKKQLVSEELLDNSQDVAVSEQEIAKAIEEINKTLALHNTRLEFSVHAKTKGIMVKVIDEKTGEVIREVPPKRVLDMVAMTWEELGLLVDEKA